MPKTTAEQLQNFFDDIEGVCKRHGLSISHEDYHGGFIIESWSKPFQYVGQPPTTTGEWNMRWLRNATPELDL